MSEQAKPEIPEDLKIQYALHLKWKADQMTKPCLGQIGSVEGILRENAIEYIERITALEAERKEYESHRQHFGELLKTAEDANAALEAERDSLKAQVERLSAPVSNDEMQKHFFIIEANRIPVTSRVRVDEIIAARKNPPTVA